LLTPPIHFFQESLGIGIAPPGGKVGASKGLLSIVFYLTKNIAKKNDRCTDQNDYRNCGFHVSHPVS
jgi:hypothetical protein